MVRLPEWMPSGTTEIQTKNKKTIHTQNSSKSKRNHCQLQMHDNAAPTTKRNTNFEAWRIDTKMRCLN
jgi:hypothetical protein